MSFPPSELFTERLHLRVPRLDDAEAVYAYASDPEVTRYLAFHTHASVADAQQFLEGSVAAWSARQGHLPWIVENRTSGALLGAIGVDVHGGRVNVGYVLARSHWGNGVMTEALAAVRDAAFADPSVFRLEAFHHVENVASGRVMEKAGMRREGVLRSYLVHPQQGDAPQDVVLWAMVRADVTR